jgi:EAL domain-containing protein (putative c-di-GMP-specific phosphodiesterase class I)
MVIRDFLPTVKSLFRNFNIDPGTMVFEITERDTVKNLQLIEDFVRKLRDEGFRFAIDDFGAGYSSFQYLKSFNVDFLKVDGEFIRHMQGNGSIEKEIVSSIAMLANKLKIGTIAEYVETESILGEVESAGIHYAQGYYIKHPSPDLG